MRTGHRSDGSRSNGFLAAPSPVIHFRNITEEIQETDLVRLMENFGTIVHIKMLREKDQALVEFSHTSNAVNFLNSYKAYPPHIGRTTVYPEFSNHRTILDPTYQLSTAQPPNRILKASITNVRYPVTVDTLSKLCSPFDTSPIGTVEKIIIFENKNGLNALIQFSSIECATNAMRQLNGQNIFDNACTIIFEYSSQDNITVPNPSDKQWDFTAVQQSYSQPRAQKSTFGAFPSFPTQISNRQSSIGSRSRTGYGTQTNTPVVILKNYPSDSLTLDHLFNIFSNYGYINCIKALTRQNDTAFIEFSSPTSAQEAARNIDGLHIFGRTWTCEMARISRINRTDDPLDSNIAIYESSSSNRFSAQSSLFTKSHYPPNDTVFISRLSDSTTTVSLINHLSTTGTVVGARVYLQNGKLSGLAQMKTVDDAIMVVALLHNSELDGSTIRVAFTTNTL
ncbi:putative Polypyrimidine tract-binding protein [Blattamonas nauphoetae]|uniref:Polypyrimidine tract-binding protein n=1 Tax=Blattamonas nauphoetae TaxID=2049346 RepID=A0ABQ9XCI8_9EUKA|nr:putative Polypyrimidine tract-binding protein [Blattamonas nauphoetae]